MNDMFTFFHWNTNRDHIMAYTKSFISVKLNFTAFMHSIIQYNYCM